MPVFLVQCDAFNSTTHTKYHGAIFTKASSDTKAAESTLKLILKKLPVSNGWQFHDTVAKEFYKEELLELADNARSNKIVEVK